MLRTLTATGSVSVVVHNMQTLCRAGPRVATSVATLSTVHSPITEVAAQFLCSLNFCYSQCSLCHSQYAYPAQSRLGAIQDQYYNDGFSEDEFSLQVLFPG